MDVVLQMVLKENGFKADSYDIAILALDNFRANLYDLLLLEIKMAEMEGLESKWKK